MDHSTSAYMRWSRIPSATASFGGRWCRLPGGLPYREAMDDRFFPYRFDARFAPMWLPFGAVPGRDGVALTSDRFRATFGLLRLDTPLDNVVGGHITEGYRWYTAIGARLSFADDGLTFGTNPERGVCVHFRTPAPRVIGFRPHSAVTVTVADCDALVEAIGGVPPAA